MSDSFGRGINYRLQSIYFGVGYEDRVFNLDFWHNCTNLIDFGIELFVKRGSVAVRLLHEQRDGSFVELALLEGPCPGSTYSDPFLISELTQKGGCLVFELVHSLGEGEESALFDLYVGTNQLPRNPGAKIAFVEAPEEHLNSRRPGHWINDLMQKHGALSLDDHFIFLQPKKSRNENSDHQLVRRLRFLEKGSYRWLRRSTHSITYGPFSVDGITHLAVLPQVQASSMYVAQDVFEEQVLRCLAVALFLREDAILHGNHTDVKTQKPMWPLALFDIHQVYHNGLPDRRLDRYLGRLSAKGAHLFPIYGQPIEYQPFSWRSRLESIRQRVRFSSSRTELVAARLNAYNQMRRRDVLHQRQLIELDSRLSPRSDGSAVSADLDRANLLALNLLRNRHEGKRAVIVGNGPSLEISDLERLKSHVTFASNKIYLAYDETDWRPTYYSVEDHLVLLNNIEKIKGIQGSIKLFPANTRDFGYHEADTIFAPFLPPNSFDEPLSDPQFPAFSRDLTHGIAWGSTIVYSQIQMAVFMGCTEIVLIGVDHSYQLPKVKHGNQYVHEGEQNHFHPDYRSPGEVWHQPNLDVLEVSYLKAREVCNQRGVAIVNASRHTQLDVFETADFDLLFPSVGDVE
jgi:hypothetical protein